MECVGQQQVSLYIITGLDNGGRVPLPVMEAISFSFANTADTISLGGVNIIL